MTFKVCAFAFVPSSLHPASYKLGPATPDVLRPEAGWHRSVDSGCLFGSGSPEATAFGHARIVDMPICQLMLENMPFSRTYIR